MGDGTSQCGVTWIRQRRGGRLRESRDSKLLTQCISFPLCRRVNQQIISFIMFNCSFCIDYSFQRSNKTRVEQHDGIHFVTSHSTEDNAGWSAVLLLNFLISFDLRCNRWEIQVANYIPAISVLGFIVYFILCIGLWLCRNLSIKFSSRRLYWQWGAVASWLVRSSTERAVRVRALAGDTVFCPWPRHLFLTHFSPSLHPEVFTVTYLKI